MGLFGLASFTTKQRTKEISIRKILGASSFTILSQLSREFSIWVLIANLLAWPVAWYIIRNFLNNYAYRITIPYVLFILTTLATLVLAWLTVGYQSIRASETNPADTLRYE